MAKDSPDPKEGARVQEIEQIPVREVISETLRRFDEEGNLVPRRVEQAGSRSKKSSVPEGWLALVFDELVQGYSKIDVPEDSLLSRAIAEVLDPRETAFILAILADEFPSDIAHRYGISPKTVSNEKERLLTKLRKYLDEAKVVSEPQVRQDRKDWTETEKTGRQVEMAPGATTEQGGAVPAAEERDELEGATTATERRKLSPELKRFMKRLEAVQETAAAIRAGEGGSEALAEPMSELIEAYQTLTGRVLGTGEAAEILDVSRVHVARMAKRGEVGEMIAGQYFFSEKELEQHKDRDRDPGGRPRKAL
jgi:hypothetical protein